MKLNAKLLISIVIIMLCFGSITAFALTDISVSEPHFYNSANTEVYSLQKGDVIGQFEIDNQTGSAQDITLLFVLYDKNTMEMKDVKLQNYIALPTGISNISATMNITYANGYVLKAFVWSNLSGNSISISREFELYDVDIAPSAPTNIKTVSSTYTEINLAWDEAYDNLKTVSYDVYRDGVFVTKTLTTSYSDTNLKYGTTYKYQIKANDMSNNTSEFSAEFSASTKAAAYCIFGATNISNLLDKPIQYTSNFDGGYYSEVVTVGPADDQRECRKIEFIKPYNGNPNGAANYLTVGIDGNYIKNTDRDLTFKLTYFDQGTDTIAIEYTSLTNTYSKLSATKTNTGKWVTSTFVVHDACFDNKQGPSSQYDLRIQVGESNTSEYVYKIEIFNGVVN